MILQEKIFSFLQMGGPVVWILALFMTVAITITLVKLGQLIYLKAEKQTHLDKAIQYWQQGETAQALLMLNRKQPQDELVALAMNGLLQNKEEALLREELERVASLKLRQLRAYLKPLEMIAALSPLLGLLGTVLGMIVAFQQMEAAGNQVDPSVLSGGIWQALLTTAVGLTVAIPVLMVYNWLERKIERIADNFSDSVTRIFTLKPIEFKPHGQRDGVRNVA